jgi:hypothetical protein
MEFAMINSSAGAKISIGPIIATTPEDESAYAALSYQEIGEVESIAPFGDKSGSISFTSLSDGRVRKLKGARDAGDFDIVFASDPSDAGQAAVIAAEKTKYTYALKIELEDAADENDTDSVFYMGVKVMGVPLNVGDNSAVTKRTATFAIDTPIVEALSETVSGP